MYPRPKSLEYTLQIALLHPADILFPPVAHVIRKLVREADGI